MRMVDMDESLTALELKQRSKASERVQNLGRLTSNWRTREKLVTMGVTPIYTFGHGTHPAAMLDAKLETFRGRIERDNWKAQARALARQRNSQNNG